MQPPLISIVIVTYNAVNCLEKAIKSVLEQKYVNVELIVVDGNSTDGTVELIQKYDPQFSRWVSEPDAGIYDAMNKGVKIARGDWLYFLGADDILVNCLDKVAQHLRNSRTIYYGDVYLPHKNKTYAGEFKYHTLISKNINHQSIFYPKDVFDHYCYDLKYKVLADYDLNLRCWGEGKFKFEYLPILVAFHNDEGVSHQKSDDAFFADKPALISKYFGRKIVIRNFWLTTKNKAGNLIRPILGKN